MTETGKLKLNDITWGIIIPLLVGILIIALPTFLGPGAKHLFGEMSPIPVILTFGLAQMVVLGIPLLLGLGWNKWAGGAAGFLMGSVFYLAYAGLFSLDYNYYGQSQWNFFRDASMLGYIVNAILIGYIAGALSKGSSSFKRMLGASLTASIITAVFQWILNATVALEPARNMTIADPPYSFFLMIVPQIALAIIIPIIAKISYGSEFLPGSRRGY